MERILVCANETLGARKLIEEVLPKAESGEAEFFLVVPQSRPKQGNVIYLEAMYDAAQVRIDLATRFMASHNVQITGEVGDPDPFTAIMDAVREYRPDHIIISTFPETSSGWLRRDLIERTEQATGLPVTHVVSDPDSEGLPFKVTLVVANQTIRGRQLHDRLKEIAADEQRLFIVVVPQEGGEGHHASGAKRRLNAMLREMQDEGLVAAGMIGDPDPYLAAVNALQAFRVSDVVISTFPNMRSRWMRAHLIERVQGATAAPVEHVVVDLEEAGV
jgi:hypothetical protein